MSQTHEAKERSSVCIFLYLVRSPDWTNLPGHQFSAEMICLGCRLSLLIGVRAVPKVIECFAAAFDLWIKIPSRDAVRNWSCRNGVAILREADRQHNRVWMIDHSVQLGRMFVLVATMIEHQLTQTTSPDHARVVEKFGWIEQFRTDLMLWRQLRRLIGESLAMANKQGVARQPRPRNLHQPAKRLRNPVRSLHRRKDPRPIRPRIEPRC